MAKQGIIHSEKAISGIRKAAQAAAFVREQLPQLVMPGMSTKHIDDFAARLIAETGGKSAFLGYHGYPGQICISVNEEVVHGIGCVTKFVNEGDIVSIDVGVNLGGYIGDNAKTFIVGNPNSASKRVHELLRVTEEATVIGCQAAYANKHISDVSRAIEKCAISAKLGVVREYVGHGCGAALHEPPEVPNYTTGFKGAKLRPGMVLAVEPMFNLGTEKVYTEPDGWTVKTKDGKWSAHFEHMVLITENEPEILTWLKM
ncbi:type I methionyl aminopeptidase [Lentisphaerota bacterium WC36G]|nr:type I methionyl aminopeptidase [Lentisphaerae bacterium WC36]